MARKFEAWKERARKGARKSEFKTRSGLEVPELSLEAENFSYEEQLGLPGEFPFTRGIHPGMYRSRLWTIRQYAGFSTAEKTNERYKLLLESGAQALSVAFDLPTQMGRDSSHSRAKGEVGRVGVAIDTVDDMKTLFDGISLRDISTSMTINSTAAILLSMYVVAAEESGIEKGEIRGTVQNDILKEFISRGTYIYPVEASLKLAVDVMDFCAKEIPKWNTISVSGYHMREAGATAAQELAFTLANGFSYLEACQGAGVEPEAVAPRISFFFNCHNNFLEEIAKFRAARRIWAKELKERFSIQNEKALRLRFHTQTAGSSLTAQQPLVNISRTTTQALAAVLGGTQSLHTNGYDEALGLPTKDSARIALRTQQYIAEETGLADVVDPLAGSYFLEELTDGLEGMAREYFEKIEKMGGMVSAIEAGFPQAEIEEAAYQFQKELESRERKIVGVNCHETPQSIEIKAERLDEKTEETQKSKLKKVIAQRDKEKVTESLKVLSEQTQAGYNLMPAIIEAVRVRATLGEISDILRDVWGEYRA